MEIRAYVGDSSSSGIYDPIYLGKLHAHMERYTRLLPSQLAYKSMINFFEKF
jgi:hypothetical protein